MGKCDFNLKFQGSKRQLMESVQSEIQNANGTIFFQNDSGNFIIPIPIGTIAGTFHFHDNQVLVEITDKPFVLTCSKIESKIKEFLLKQKD